MDRETIYTYEDGTPIEGRPDVLADDASADEKIAHMQAWNAYFDRVRDVFNAGFSAALRRALTTGWTES